MVPELTPEQRKQIYDEEKQRLSATARWRRHLPRILVAASTALIVLVGGGWFAFHAYQVHLLKQKLAEAIGKDLGLTETILKVESDSSKMTYAELFDLCNKSVEGRTNLIVELRGLYPEMDYGLKNKLVEYLNAENEFVRSKRDFYRRSMELSSAQDAYLEAIKDFPTSSYGWDFYNHQKQQYRDKVIEAARQAEQSADEFLKAYENMGNAEPKLGKEIQAVGMRFTPIFQKYAKDNQKPAQDTKKAATEVAQLR
jgi:tetratricopeptide (TPR) repeat protein